MRKYLNAEASQHEMKLTQMGATVKQVNSKMCFVKFKRDHFTASYVYNINNHNKYFLERIKPYSIITKEFESEEDVIKVIEIDIKQLDNASKSKNFDHFILINNQLNQLKKEFEDLYLYYNVPQHEIAVIMKKLKEIHEEIIQTKDENKRVFFDKDPEYI
jgi:hypothetical protein